MRLIDADALANWIITELRTTPHGVFDALNGRQAANLIGKSIDEAPTAEPEEVEPAETSCAYKCGSCGAELAEICGDVIVTQDGTMPTYCWKCGRKVKWND